MKRRGAMLVTLLILTGVVALTLSLGLARRSVNETGLSLGLAQLARAETIADGCMEDAFLHIKDNSSYTGGTFSYPASGGECTITVSHSGSEFSVTVSATADRWTRVIFARVKRTPSPMTLLEWTIR